MGPTAGQEISVNETDAWHVPYKWFQVSEAKKKGDKSPKISLSWFSFACFTCFSDKNQTVVSRHGDACVLFKQYCIYYLLQFSNQHRFWSIYVISLL